MEKKLIPQGTEKNRSFTITVPISWVRNNGLDKHGEVDLEIVNNRVLVSVKKLKNEKFKIDARKIDFILGKIIAEKYKLGVDEIEINFDNVKTLDIIRDVVEKQLMGFEFLEESRSNLIIKDVSKESVEDFEKTLRRCFHFLQGMADETFNSVRNKDYSYLKRVIERDKDLNKLVYYCERQLNKKSQEYYGKTQFYFFLLERIENIGDMYKGICRFFLEKKKPLKPETLKLIDRINRKLEEFTNLFYSKDFNYESVKNYFEEIRKIRAEVIKLHNCKNPDIVYFYYISGLSQLINGMVRSLYTLKEINSQEPK